MKPYTCLNIPIDIKRRLKILAAKESITMVELLDRLLQLRNAWTK